MNVLGIETSCDETAASVVRDGKRILSNVISTTLLLHKKYGGIIPEIAARGHLEAIDIVTRQAIKKANISLADIDIIAVTSRPGLPGALLVGQSFARALSFALGLPLVEVDHIQAHLYAPFLYRKNNNSSLRPPFVGLVVSGGHTSIFYFRNFKDFQLLGETRDDAAGEAFDKVAKILGLAFPGGPEIDRLARTVSNTRLRFNCARLPETLDFSFSGIKTSVLYFVAKRLKKDRLINLPLRLRAEIASAFQDSVIDILVEKAIAACRQRRVRNLIIGGGVAANSLLRKKMLKLPQAFAIRVHFAKQELCLDNAAMVAGLAYHQRN